MARILVLSTSLILGLVCGTYQLNPAVIKNGYSSWIPMCSDDYQHVCEVLATKFSDFPQCGGLIKGMKEKVSDGTEFRFYFEALSGKYCCGHLNDEYHVNYHYLCGTDFNQCMSNLFE